MEQRKARFARAGILVVILAIFSFIALHFSSQAEVQARAKATPKAIKTVQGTVLTPDGKLVANADVSWIAPIHKDSREFKQFATVKTDATGHFTFDDTQRIWEKSEQYPSATVLAEAKGWGVSWACIPKKGEPLTITLTPATSLRMAFVDEQHKPVAGLRVIPDLLHHRKPQFGFFRFPASVSDRYAQVTDAKGECKFPDLPQGATLRIHIDDERFAQLDIINKFKNG